MGMMGAQPQPGKGGMPPSQMGGNPQNVSIPGLYQQQQNMVSSGMFGGTPQSQFPPGYLQQVAGQGLAGFGAGAGGSNAQGTGGSNVQGPGYGSSFSRPASEGGGGYAGGESGVRSMGAFGGPRDTGWMPSWLRQPNQGSMTGLNIAENGRSIGSGLGLLLGVPGMGLLGNYLGDQYIGNNVFQSPFTSPVQQDINNFVGGPGSPAFDNAQARMNSSSGGEYAGPGAGRMNQRGNRHAGMPSDFRTQFNWAHGGSGGGGGGANALVPFYLT